MQKENRNNRVHTGEQSGKTDFLIERLLPVGKENAITTQDLVKLSGCGSARELQQRIAYEREQGAIICSGSGRGYWRPKDRQEIQEFVHTMNARALNTLKAVKSAKRALKVPEEHYFERRTMKQIGERMGCSGAKAGDIERKALRKLRLPHVNRKYKEYHEQYLTPYPIMHIGIDSFQRTGYSEVERAVLGW